MLATDSVGLVVLSIINNTTTVITGIKTAMDRGLSFMAHNILACSNSKIEIERACATNYVLKRAIRYLM